jgi:methyl-accepting chemotaxis protein
MELKKAIEIINNQGFTAYELHKETGLNESGLRRVLANEVEKPQRKTRLAIIKFALDHLNTIESDTILNKEIKGISNEKSFNTLNIDAKLDELHNLLQIIRDSGKETKNKIEANRDLIAQTNRSMFEQSMNFQEVLDELEEKRKRLKG